MRTKRNYKSIESLKDKTQSDVNLYNLISKRVYLKTDGWVTTNNILTDELIDKVCDLLGGQHKTRERISIVLKNQTFSKWYLERIMYNFKRKCFTYCAGQDYPAELQEIRKDLVNRY